jgi:hypothetical protein
MDKIKKTLLYLFEKLSSKPHIGGLQITDFALQYLIIRKEKIETYALRLPPGVLRQGQIADEAAFLKALRDFHDLIARDHLSEVLKVVVALPPSLVYTQSFAVPNIGNGKLEESSRLNLQMISPRPASEVYMSSQVLYETTDHYELLGAFAEKKIVDRYRALLEAARFAPIIFEFPALAISRVIQLEAPKSDSAILVLQISSDGLDIFIYKNNNLYFDYFRSWQSIQGDAREISRELFEKVVLEESQKVINFSLNRFKEIPKEAILIAPGFESELQRIIERGFELKAAPLTLRAYAVSPVWFAVLGSALRGSWDRSRDNFISFGTEEAITVFYEERLISFINLWRNILAATFGLFLVLYIAAASFLVREERSFESRFGTLIAASTEKELAELQAKAEEFNKLVGAVASVKSGSHPWVNFFSKIKSLADKNGVTIESFNIQSFNAPIVLSGRAPDHNTIIKFKNVLVADPSFKEVDLPLSQISLGSDNSVSFNLNFVFVP